MLPTRSSLFVTWFIIALAGCGDDGGSNGAAGPTGTGAGSSGSAGPSDPACRAAQSESACLACTKNACCAEIAACVDANPNCVCALDCIAKLPPSPPQAAMMACAGDCGVGHEAMTALFDAVGCWQGCPACPAIERPNTDH